MRATMSPSLHAVLEDPEKAIELDGLSDAADGSFDGSSHVGSLINSVVNSAVSDSRRSSMTGGNFSALTAPPRYRNSGVFVHGTKFRNFASIMEHGLKAAKSDIFMIDEVHPDGRVPGLREPPQILIFIDENKARSKNMEFEYDAGQGTWKTKGINGVIRPWFFQKVVDQRRGPGRLNILFQSKEDPMMQANVMQRSQQPKYLIHATYWENVRGIMQEGIMPAKNPTSTSRQPFKDLLQGAENHVYTVSLQAVARQPDASALDGLVCSDFGRKISEPEAVPEEEELEYRLGKEALGLERPPDAFFVIDTHKAEELGAPLEMVQSADREECIYVQGRVPREALASVESNDPVDLPESLKAKIVDPRSFLEIPVIDLSLDEGTVVEQLRYACEVVGFMQVVGHGVPQELVDRHAQMQRRFFALPSERKARLALDAASPVRGHFGRGGEDLDQVLTQQVDGAGGRKIAQQARSDNKEALDTNGVPWSRPRGGYVAEIFGMPSRLPAEEELPGFEEVLDEYAREMFRLGRRLLALMARVLGHPADFFEAVLTAPVATHRLLHYWPIQDFNTQIGVGEHTDYGLLTILKQDKVGGLQVLNARDTKWVHCCPMQDAFVVNLGDMMGRWSAHRFKSTVHRVVNVSPQERFSAAYFLEPNMETLIVPGALCEGAEASGPVSEHRRRCRLRGHWKRARAAGVPATAEEILERFYRASGQLRHSSKGQQAARAATTP
mmetsp:Transcript_43333/g.123550  ORF Transcript_43333/g.123550 Transcript_43333/m.123550 type:complete len:727 (-) Transcript_43333:53-2233(-)